MLVSPSVMSSKILLNLTQSDGIVMNCQIKHESLLLLREDSIPSTLTRYLWRTFLHFHLFQMFMIRTSVYFLKPKSCTESRNFQWPKSSQKKQLSLLFSEGPQRIFLNQAVCFILLPSLSFHIQIHGSQTVARFSAETTVSLFLTIFFLCFSDVEIFQSESSAKRVQIACNYLSMSNWSIPQLILACSGLGKGFILAIEKKTVV